MSTGVQAASDGAVCRWHLGERRHECAIHGLAGITGFPADELRRMGREQRVVRIHPEDRARVATEGKKETSAMFGRITLPIVFCLFTAISVHAQGYGVGTPVEAKKMVERAVEYIKTHGEEEALKEFNRPNGKFQWRDLYVFAYDSQGVVIGHPNPKLIGQNLYDVPDSQGKLFRKEIVDLANWRGSGWVDYTYMDPLIQREVFKITHFQKVGELIVCAGAYLP